ncbi:PREDICTED: elongation of very long chain fatty acids protein AAEL008004-like [Ceratosolen solmsi marchali]|uniref:Elongation of very long chain fatty acids protein n=1 Tax=Ceratosolen solmsi marchali TaxID=326594 RepID=A0AAJ6YGE2_9HYME|nr:PREDICTED: elongation of very long chain fatty acids protein AAEL008004-like [Ceratosolen solmsi marchali]
MHWLSELYHYYNVEQADPRTNSWFFIENPLYLLSVVFGYIYFVLLCGPKYMEKRKPYSLKTAIFFYNLFQIVINAIIVYEIYVIWTTDYSLGCEPVRQNIDKHVTDIVIWILLLKTFDLLETLIFVLRKKMKQVSFLHVYHHISTVLITYYIVKYHPGGMFLMLMIINGSVHVAMYTYYLFASLGSTMENLTNIVKPYVTRIQIIQFLILLVHQSQALFPSCSVSKKAATIVVGDIILNLALFLKFYRNNYTKSSKIA